MEEDFALFDSDSDEAPTPSTESSVAPSVVLREIDAAMLATVQEQLMVLSPQCMRWFRGDTT